MKRTTVHRLGTALLALGLGCAAGRPHRVLAQVTEPPAPGRPDVDDAVARARAAQEHFEKARRDALPIDQGWVGGPCDERVGRMCWREHTSRPRPSPAEPASVRGARDSLLAILDDAARTAGADAWLLGQRVRYRIEAGRTEEARALAWRCGGAPTWWCSALEGLALHVQGRYVLAERAFDAALEHMDPEEATRWGDVTPLLDGRGRDLLEEAARSSDTGEEAFLRRFWAWADPLRLVPGNDRRTEHLARRTWIRILSGSAVPYEISWRDDMAELLLRYGRDVGWAWIPPRAGDIGGLVVVGHEDPDIRRFAPPGDLLADPSRVEDEPWAPFIWEHARTGYAPAYAPVFLPMRSRFLVFPREGSALVAATFAFPPDTTLRGREHARRWLGPPAALDDGTVRAGFFVSRAEGTVVAAMSEEDRTTGTLSVTVPVGAYVASVEVLDPRVGRAGRLRNGLHIEAVPSDLPSLSDVLVVSGDTLPETTLEALGRLRVDDEVPAGTPAVVGWELWGLGRAEETLGYRLSLHPFDGDLEEQLRVGRARQTTLPSLEWTEPGPGRQGATFQAASLDLPDVPPGEYSLCLELRLRGRTPLARCQHVRIVEPEGGGAR